MRRCAAVQEIAHWLDKLGMSEYTERFAENDIDASVLPHLTDQSLKELGVSLGHRLKILAAIRELSGPTPAASEPPTLPSGAEVQSHRRTASSHGDALGGCRFDSTFCAHGPGGPTRDHFGLSEVCRHRRKSASAGSSRSTWATVSLSTSGIRKRMRMTPSERYGSDWN